MAGAGLWEASVRVMSGREESMTAAVEERRLLLLTRWRFFGPPPPPVWFPIIVFPLDLDKEKVVERGKRNFISNSNKGGFSIL